MTDNKTATERLRDMLDEREVEWSSPSGLNSSFADSITFIGDVAVVSKIEGSDLLRINFDGTPEQAIAATLGDDGVGRSNDGVATLGSDEYQRGYDDGLHANTKAAFAAARRTVQDAVGECEKLPSTNDKTCIVRDNRTGCEMEFGYWRCSNCGCNNFDGAKHCMGCGARVVEG